MATILVVDDLSANRAVLLMLLRRQGHRLLEAVDGRAALATVRADRPDLVITDVLMPVMDGYEFVRQLRLDAVMRAVPVVFYTAHYGEREARALAHAGYVSAVLTKPVDSQDVLTIVSRVLAGGSATDMLPRPASTAFEGDHLRLFSNRPSEHAADLRVANARLRALINIGLELGSERDFTRLLERAGVAARDLFGATYVTLGILDRSDRTVLRVVTDGVAATPWITPGDSLSGILGTVVAARRPIRGENADGNPLTLQLPPFHPTVHAFLIVPIVSGADVCGWICLVRNEGQRFTADDEHLVLALSGQVGRIHENTARYAAQQRADEFARGMLDRQETQAALRTSERLNRTLIDHLPHRIVVTDQHSVILFCNVNYANDVGLAPEGLIGTEACGLHPGPLADAYKADDQAVMADGCITHVEASYRVGGQDRWIHTVKVPYRDVQGQVIGIVAVFEDVTERRTLEAQYQQAQRLEAIGRLAGGVAHDFNNLLTVILGYCELLLAAIEPTNALRADISEIHRAGGRAARLTRQFLAFSRKEIIEPTPLDLNAVVSDMHVMLARLLGDQAPIVLALDPQPTLLKADRGQLEQILMNLVVNAGDAMPDGGTVSIETAHASGDVDGVPPRDGTQATHVVLTVTDTGTGMTPEVQARLFEPFFTTKGPGKGTGLGLATVHNIVTRGGGRITASTAVGRGTSFIVHFPAATAADLAVTVPRSDARALTGRPLVLVVDDTAEVRALAQKLLVRQGFTVRLAADAEEAIRLFEWDPSIEVVLTDVVMPGASGPELTRRLIGQRPTLKVVYMSGYTEQAIAHHGVLKPGIAFLHKPFSAETLGQKIREALSRAPEPRSAAGL